MGACTRKVKGVPPSTVYRRELGVGVIWQLNTANNGGDNEKQYLPIQLPKLVVIVLCIFTIVVQYFHDLGLKLKISERFCFDNAGLRAKPTVGFVCIPFRE